MKFSELGLHPDILAGVEANKFMDCTPVQEKAIPLILDGKDVAGLAQTGTGKTAAFLLPLMERMRRSLGADGEAVEATESDTTRAFSDWKPTNFTLILVPTRELAEQVVQNVKTLGQPSGFKSVAIYGGTSYDPQKKALKSGVDFVVATPGRLIDLYKEHMVDLSQVRAVVFDEADRMFDMGFKDDMKYILKRTPRDRQFLVFSATLNFDVLNVAYEFGAEPTEINISRDQAKAENVDDEIFHLGHNEKPAHLLSLLKKFQPKQTIIFSNFKNNVDRVARFLSDNGLPAMGISSLLNQGQRNRVIQQFKAENNQNILVATDVAARGLDIKGVDLVVNYELPDDPENYVHRIGRTGRAGEKGKAYSLVSDRDVDALARIEEFLDHKVRLAWLDEVDILKEFESFPEDANRDRRQKIHKREKGRQENRDGRKFEGKKPQSAGKTGKTRTPRKKSTHAKSESARPERTSASPAKHKHRDRVTGRHGTSEGEKAKTPTNSKPRRPSNRKTYSAPPNGNGSRPATGGKTRVVRKGGKTAQGKYRGGRYRVEQKKSLGEKVSGFIKNLFSK